MPRLLCLLLLIATFGTAAADPAPEAPTPATTTDAQLESPLRVGDAVSIVVREDPDLHFEGAIGESGIIRLAYLGDFLILGLTPAQAELRLAKALEADLYQKATVSVNLVSRAPGTVYIYGAVKQPGAVALPIASPLTVLQALSKVGGISSWADAQRCRITRTDARTKQRQWIDVNLELAFQDIGGQQDTALADGDVIFVPASNAQGNQILSTEPIEVIVVGEVHAPGIIAFSPGETHTVLRALFKAGNFTPAADQHHVRLVRTDKGEREVILIDVATIMDEGNIGQDRRLQAGDMIIVDPVAPRTVFVYGAVKTPGPVQMPLQGESSIIQMVTKAGGATAWADGRSAYILRKSKTSDERDRIPVDLEASVQEYPGENKVKLQDQDILFVPSTNTASGQVLSTEPCEVIVVGQVNNPGVILFAAGEGRTLLRAIFKAGNFTPFAKSKKVRLVRYAKGERENRMIDVEEIMKKGDLALDVDLQAGDMIIVDQNWFSFQ